AGQRWYRLRVGPFSTRAEAERVLSAAQNRYPRAWLALNDETADLTAVERASTASIAATGPTDPPLPDAERKQILRAARVALAQYQYPQAVELLTRLLRQPEYPGRAEAQELIGLVRERAGQLAHAKAEDQEYLRRYPDGPAAARVRARLLALLTAGEPPQSAGQFAAPSGAHVWSAAGSAAVTYQYGQNQQGNVGSGGTSTALNAALVYGDLLLRERGPRFETTLRADAGYTANFIRNIGGSQDRTTSAYLEVDDRLWGWNARVGRQALNTQGNIGLFDGVYLGYQASPKLMISAAGGFPAYTSYSPVGTQDRFATLSAEFGPYRRAWIFDAYLFDEVNGGLTERRALGLQTRYQMPGFSAMLLTDYDIAFHQLNAVTLFGNLSAWRRWVLGFDVDHRRSPLLLLSNALIGQSALTLPELQIQFTPAQIREFALDRTAISDTYTLSATHPLGERWQFIGDLSALQLGGTAASGGAAATPPTGLDKTLSLQMAGSSLLQAGDLHFFGTRFDDSPLTRSVTLSWDARFVLPGAWRVGPRFSVERLQNAGLGGTELLYLPELRGDWTGRWSIFELIAGYQVQQIPGTQGASAAQTRFLYASATYRVRF
ncbi:MAG TPA: SPOR domain-containing protein, partial [Steroidobacteraceae bacterium]|nr:SPOR domain-containing protein [Steroidobacteraceae bacterium]